MRAEFIWLSRCNPGSPRCYISQTQHIRWPDFSIHLLRDEQRVLLLLNLHLFLHHQMRSQKSRITPAAFPVDSQLCKSLQQQNNTENSPVWRKITNKKSFCVRYGSKHWPAVHVRVTSSVLISSVQQSYPHLLKSIPFHCLTRAKNHITSI